MVHSVNLTELFDIYPSRSLGSSDKDLCTGYFLAYELFMV